MMRARIMINHMETVEKAAVMCATSVGRIHRKAAVATYRAAKEGGFVSMLTTALLVP